MPASQHGMNGALLFWDLFLPFFKNMTGKAATKDNAWELAVKAAAEEEARRKTDPNESHEKSLIVLGSKEVGKTTMIYRFLEKEDSPKATLAMDYSYGKKAGKSLIKDVAHVWEVGHLSSTLIAAAMTGCTLLHSPHHTTVFVVLDLGKPEILWSTLEECLAAIRSAMEAAYDEGTRDELRQRRLEFLRERARGEEPPVAEPFPMRLCLVAGKYDEFRDVDGDDKEFVGQILRAAAHVLGADLHYHTAKDSQILRKSKELLSHYGFRGHSTRASVTDYDKPLSVPAGGDSFAAIDLQLAGGRPAATLDQIREIYLARFPQTARELEASIEDPADDPDFAEPLVDRLRLQREQEISVQLRDMLEAPATTIPIPEPY